MGRFQSYHWSWLSAHPNRSAAWLSQRLADGFDVHHVDRNHSNDDPGNLVLIECGDHFMLHSGVRTSRLNLSPRKPAVNGMEAYELFRNSDLTWAHIAVKLKATTGVIMHAAKRVAATHALPWPN